MPLTRRPVHLAALAFVLAPFFVAGLTRAAAPAGRYTVPVAGTVLDTKTRLTWQQKASTTPVALGAASSLCFNLPLANLGWRLPTVKELLTLTDALNANSLDATAFPSEPTGLYWSKTLVTGSPTMAWYVAFSSGGSPSGTEDTTTPHLVRCVH